MNLYKTTIVVWSDEDPQGLEIDELCREAVSGSSYCSEILFYCWFNIPDCGFLSTTILNAYSLISV